MSTTENRTRRNQEPEPVRPWFARLFRRRPTRAAIARANLRAVNPAEALASGMRQAEALRTAREDVERWKQHAESYDRERGDALRECALLLAWIAALHPASAVIAPAHDGEGTLDLYIVAGGWQLCWSVPEHDASLFQHVTAVDVTDARAQWDGHGTEQRGERIHNHIRLLALDDLGANALTVGPTPSRSEAHSA
ncbi:hypothetical protein AB0F46_29425 [Streptomyces sp. NPDC026665]|uniref:hypothetical protein n=1 Tax=Streptomyces sp. NPDC026665 TaxID=3154798 RepID=UPI0033C101A4